MAADMKQEIQEAVAKLQEGYSSQTKQAVEQALTKISQGNSLKDALGLTKDSEEDVYEKAYNFFQSGQYKYAHACFDLLTKIDPFSYRYLFALAACNQHMESYEEAIMNYFSASNVDPLNPVPYFHTYSCFMALKQPMLAINALVTTITLSDHKPELYAELRERAQLEYKGLKKFLRNKEIKKRELIKKKRQLKERKDL